MQKNDQRAYEQVLAHFKEKQIRLTETRKALIEYLIEAKHHPSAEMIYRDLQESYSHISLASVYNNLNLLVDEGLVSVVKISNDNTTYFDFNGHNHLHIVCESCGQITDVGEDVDDLINMAELETNYLITKRQFVIYGICPDCQRKNKG